MNGIKIGNTYYYPGDTFTRSGIKIGDSYYSLSALIAFIILILVAVYAIVMPILYIVNYHRVVKGKEPIFKGKVRKIIIVNKREIDHDFYAEGCRASNSASSEPTATPDGVFRQTSVDFRKVSGKILYTKSIDDELYDQLEVGRAYKVRIRSGVIDKLYERIPNYSLEK